MNEVKISKFRLYDGAFRFAMCSYWMQFLIKKFKLSYFHDEIIIAAFRNVRILNFHHCENDKIFQYFYFIQFNITNMHCFRRKIYSV